MAGIILVCVAAVLWGTTGVANSLMSGGTDLDPVLAAFARTALGAGGLLLAASALKLPRSGRPPIKLLMVFGLSGAIFQVCLFAAYVEAGVTVTVAVTVCAPVVLVVAVEAAWRRRCPGLATIAAISIATIGVTLTMFHGATADGSEWGIKWRGVALLAAATVSYAAVAAASTVMAKDLHPVRATGLGLGISAGALALIVMARPEVDVAALGALPRVDLALLAYIGIVATGLAYLAFVSGLGISRSATSGLAATLIEPGVAALLAAWLLAERLTEVQSFGCILMLAAMLVLFAAERGRPAARETSLAGGVAT